MDKLTISQAYFAMMDFLNGFYQRTKSDDVGALLGGMEVIGDWGTLDPAAWADWNESVQRILAFDVPEIHQVPQRSHIKPVNVQNVEQSDHE